MRRCLLLPMHYENDENLSFSVFEELENYLRTSRWCHYQSNSAILEILSPYKANLDQYLVREDVLKIIAQKTNSGSLIKVKITPKDTGVELSMNVIGMNGSDVYASQNTTFERANSYVIAQMVKNWLEEYRQSIPYDGLIIDALGSQFTIDIGSDSELFPGSTVSIVRPGKRKRHPLLQEIVEYRSTPVGEGKILDVTENQGRGKILSYEEHGSLKIGDWVRIQEHQKRESLKINKYERKNNYKFGKIGEWEFTFPFGASNRQEPSKSNVNMTGLGLELTWELWITRKYWTSFSYGQKFGIFDYQGFNNNSRLRIKAGYRYLPLDFFHGPQINPFLGYGQYRYKLQSSTSISFQGFLLGVNCRLPLKKMFSLNAELGFITAASYSEGASKSSNYHMEVGFSYWYNPRSKLLTSYDFVNNVAYLNDSDQVKVREHRLKMGLSFIF